MAGKNYLFGYGERLTSQIPPVRTRMNKVHPYSQTEAITRLAPQLKTSVGQVQQLPDLACPEDQAVISIILHPAYLARSYFPKDLLKVFELRAVGSKPEIISPEKVTQKKPKEKYQSTRLFIAGKRTALFSLADEVINLSDKFDSGLIRDGQDLARDDESYYWLTDLIKFESVKPFHSGQRLKRSLSSHKNENLYELVLHCSGIADDEFILQSFLKYAKKYGANPHIERRIFAQGLCFIPIETDKNTIRELEKFAFVRLIRNMPELRTSMPKRRSIKRVEAAYTLPDSIVVDKAIRAAIFDCGFPKKSTLNPWVNSYDLVGSSNPSQEDEQHGENVTSAFLFGAIQDGQHLGSPYANVDNYKVCCENTDHDEDLFDVIERIKTVLSSKKYDFVNFSVGPRLPIEDDDVHVWTATLDDLFSDGQTLATVAVGNDGDLDRHSGNARVQVPSDAVNCLAVGAANSLHPVAWGRAEYSCIGPGRSPGLVKPDVLAFGGEDPELFHVVDSTSALAPGISGTSFAAPLAMRFAAGMRATLGQDLNPLTCKALLIHHSDHGNYPKEDVGWGRIPAGIDDALTSDDTTAKIIYQGTLEPSKFLRAQIPMINDLPGKIKIKATFCFSSHIVSEEPSNYTNSGLIITFRPDTRRTDVGSGQIKSESFFKREDEFQTELDLRSDSQKWETVLHNSLTKMAKNYWDPFFDIHYVAREGSESGKSAQKIPYSLVISVQATKCPDLYNRIAQKYHNRLEIMQPIDVRVII